jgi:hypothetical protein
MRIGSSDNFLALEKTNSDVPSSGWKLKAVVTGQGWSFSTVDEKLIVDTSGETCQQVREFSELNVHRIQVNLSEGGWLRVKRDPQGRVLVRYRVNRLKIGAAAEGEIVLDAVAAIPFCKELQALL